MSLTVGWAWMNVCEVTSNFFVDQWNSVHPSVWTKTFTYLILLVFLYAVMVEIYYQILDAPWPNLCLQECNWECFLSFFRWPCGLRPRFRRAEAKYRSDKKPIPPPASLSQGAFSASFFQFGLPESQLTRQHLESTGISSCRIGISMYTWTGVLPWCVNQL